MLGKNNGDSAPSMSMVKKQLAELSCGRISTTDAEGSSRPKETFTPKNFKSIKSIE